MNQPQDAAEAIDIHATSNLIERIERVDLRVRDIDRALEFYRDIVGLEVLERDGAGASLGGRDGAVIALTSEGVTTPAARRATGLFHTAIRYPNRRGLAEALVRLDAAGYRVGVGDHGVSEALYVDDPDGNGVELYRDRPRDQWPRPGPGERVRMGTGPIDLNELVSDVGSGAAEARAPAGTSIGHVHLQVGDLDRTIAFYRGALGLDLMATLGNQAAFFASRGYHHHIGANVWNSRGQGPAERTHAGLERVVLHVETRQELRDARDRLSSAGHDVAGDDAELVVGDPDGIELRFVTDGTPNRR